MYRSSRVAARGLSLSFVALSLASGLLPRPGWAGDVEVRSKGAPVVVVRDGAVLGTTPITLRDLPEGTVQLGFREAPLAATAFTQLVPVPAKMPVPLMPAASVPSVRSSQFPAISLPSMRRYGIAE